MPHIKNTIKPITTISILTAILLVVGCFRLPIGYYTFLRIVVFVAAGFLLFKLITDGNNQQAIIMGLVAILFNPIIPIYLHSKTAWIVIDALTAVWFVSQPLIRYFKEQRKTRI